MSSSTPSPNDPTISLVIVSYNTRELLRQCLASVARHCPQAQVVVVDNGSRDDTAAMIRRDFPGARLVESPENVGFAGGNNLGLVHADGQVVVLLNSDTVLEDDSLVRCARWLRDHPEVGACSPRLVGIDDQEQRCFYRFPSLRDELGIALRRVPPPPSGTRDPGAWLAGTALMIRREALQAVDNRLDDACFMYWEDADLSARLRRAGWDLAVVPDAWIRHHGGASGGGNDDRRRADLQAWIYYGKYRWFRRHRGLAETAGVWLLDVTNVGRMLLRSVVRADRRHDAVKARVLVQSLARALIGRTPPRPGRR